MGKIIRTENGDMNRITGVIWTDQMDDADSMDWQEYEWCRYIDLKAAGMIRKE